MRRPACSHGKTWFLTLKDTRIHWVHNEDFTALVKERDTHEFVQITCQTCPHVWHISRNDLAAQRTLWPILRPWRAELIELGLWQPPARSRKAAS